MRSFHVVVLCALAFAAPVAGQDPCGTIDTTSATVEAGASAAPGAVTIESCPLAGVPPVPPPIGGLGTMGTFTGSLPAFPGGGDESDGAFDVGVDFILSGGTYDFTTFKLANAANLTWTGPVTINTTGDMDVEGWMDSATDSAPLTINCGGFFRMTGSTRSRRSAAGSWSRACTSPRRRGGSRASGRTPSR